MVGTTAWRCAAVAVLLGFMGCGGTDRVPLQGSVTYDGAPIDNGTIVFVPSGQENDPRPKAGKKIENGKYQFEPNFGPLPGSYRVEITWDKKTGRKVSTGDGGTRDETKNTLPAKYSGANSTLSADVKVGMKPPLDFHLAK